MKRREAIMNCINSVDWDKAQKMYQSVNWFWAIYHRVPTAAELKDYAIDLANQLLDNGSEIIGSGGITIIAFENYVGVFTGAGNDLYWLSDDEEMIKDIIE